MAPRPIRVLHVLPGIAPRYGGPSTVIRPMAEALARLPGVAVEIAATDADGPTGRLRPEDLPPSPVPVRLFPRTASEQWKISLPLRKWLNAHAGDYDLLHVHALWSFATAAACSAARRHRKPVVVRPCGMLSAYTWNRAAWKKRLYWGLVERRNVAGARAVHVTSPGEAEDVARLGLVPADRVFDIPLGMEPEAWEAPRKPAPLGFDGRPVVLFLSRLHPKKGVADILLPAFARLKSDAVLAVAGAADERTPTYDAEVRETAVKLGIGDRVRLLGPVAAADRWAVYDAAGVFVLPSHSENFGVVVTEAMARGVPVVVTDAVQSCEHVTAAGAGMVVPVNPGAVAAALDSLLADPAGRKAAGDRGRAYVREHLAWDGIAKRIEAMYRTCLS